MQQIYMRTSMPKYYFNKVALQSNFIEITLWHGCSPVNLLYIFRKHFNKNASGGLLLWRDFRHKEILYDIYIYMKQSHRWRELNEFPWARVWCGSLQKSRFFYILPKTETNCLITELTVINVAPLMESFCNYQLFSNCPLADLHLPVN